VDGVLLDEDSPPPDLYESIISRVKVLADLDISERRLPQDGRIRHAVSGREIDLRVATMPHIEGEGVVLRILDRTSVKADLRSLGLQDAISARLETLLEQPHGIFLVTGPTGAGKTTTLYAALRHLVRPERNVLSVEDPVEYHLDGVAQIQVHRKIGLDFPNILRAVLRQDPDIIMIGEIRDQDTASIANQAALTGHFVLSTLHTNSAAAAIPRLIDMGVEPYLLSSTIRGVMSQRLVRSLCPNCAAVPQPAELETLRRLAGERRIEVRSFGSVRSAVGCKACSNTGYRGRTAVAELVVIDDGIRQAILDRADAASIEALVR
jgi:general secretion pathway protein E